MLGNWLDWIPGGCINLLSTAQSASDTFPPPLTSSPLPRKIPGAMVVPPFRMRTHTGIPMTSTSVGEDSPNRGSAVGRFTSSPSLPRSSSAGFTFTPLPLLSRYGDKTRKSAIFQNSSWVGRAYEEPKDEEYEEYEEHEEYREISPELTPPPPPAKPGIPGGKRKRAAATPTHTPKSAAPRKRGRNKLADSSSCTAKEQPPRRIEDEPNEEGYSEDDQQGKRNEPTTWTKEELDLVDELCKENKTGREIWLELKNKLGCTKSLESVGSRRRRMKVSQVTWSDEDVYTYTIFVLFIYISAITTNHQRTN